MKFHIGSIPRLPNLMGRCRSLSSIYRKKIQSITNIFKNQGLSGRNLDLQLLLLRPQNRWPGTVFLHVCSHLHKDNQRFFLSRALQFPSPHNLFSSPLLRRSELHTFALQKQSLYVSLAKLYFSICKGDILIFLTCLCLPIVGKQKLEQESHAFQEKQERAYFFVEVKNVPTCLICKVCLCR